MNETMTRAEQMAFHESELRRLKAELDAERGLVEGEDCWAACPTGEVERVIYVESVAVPCFPYTDDGKRKAERAAKMMASLNFEDPPFEVGNQVFFVRLDGTIFNAWLWEDKVLDVDAWHQGRIHATEAEALAWRDKFNAAWTGGKS